MLLAKMVVDYHKFTGARVIIFVDVTDAKKARRLFQQHGEAIERLARLFNAEVMMVEGSLLEPERIFEEDLADAWILLRLDGPNKSLATRKYPQLLNLDARTGWENYAFQEIIRQIKETREITEQVTGYYTRYPLGAPSLPPEPPRPGVS